MENTLRIFASLFLTISVISLVTVSGHNLPRQADGTVIDLAGFPRCASVCTVYFRTLGCDDPVSKDCFCGKPNPLSCAWRNSVDWPCWDTTENWFATQCPSVKDVDVEGIPFCALECFNDPMKNLCFDHKFTKNCVCTNGKPACDLVSSSCNETELAKYDSWFAGECIYNITIITSSSLTTPTPTSTATESQTFTIPSPSSPSTTKKDPSQSEGSTSTGMIVGASIGGFAVTIIIGGIIYVLRRNPRQPAIERTTVLQEQSGDSGARRRSELMGSTMMPVEVPATDGPFEAPATLHISPVWEKG